MVSCDGGECEGVYQNNETYFSDITYKPYPFFCFRNDEHFIRVIGSTAFVYPPSNKMYSDSSYSQSVAFSDIDVTLLSEN